MLIGRALANALAFNGSSYLFSKLSKDSIGAERKRHDQAIEKLQKAKIEWAIITNWLYQPTTQVGNQSGKQIHRIKRCNERIS